MEGLFKNPTVLIIAGIGIFGAIILLRNQGGTPSTGTLAGPSTTGTQPGNSQQLSSNGQTAVNALGGTYSYLDGSGMQHIIATDPYGNLVGYSNLPPDISNPQPNQLSTYVGSMSGQYIVPPWGGTSPSYSTLNPTVYQTTA